MHSICSDNEDTVLLRQAVFTLLTLSLTWMTANAVAGNQLNPDITLLLDGRYISYNNSSKYELPGFMLAEDARREDKGLQLGQSELLISDNIDDRIYAQLTTTLSALDGATEVMLDEAYIKTLNLNYGLALKAGRFYSDIGYHNNQHPYEWDFSDRPLIYRGLFGNVLLDDGLQFSWRPPISVEMIVGAEITRGDQFPSAGASNDGTGARAFFVKFHGQMGSAQSWSFGLSRWAAEVEERPSTAVSETTAIPSYSGNTTITGMDMHWRLSRDNLDRDVLTFQAEFFVRDENGRVELTGSDPLQQSSYDGEQAGWYAQAVYNPLMKWRLGIRHDQLGSHNDGNNPYVLRTSGIDDKGQHPRRTTVMIDYTQTQQSRFRIQYAVDESYQENDNIFMLQYQLLMGKSRAFGTD